MMLLILYAVAILKTFNLSMTCYEDWSRLLILDYFPIMLDQSEVKLVLIASPTYFSLTELDSICSFILIFQCVFPVLRPS